MKYPIHVCYKNDAREIFRGFSKIPLRHNPDFSFAFETAICNGLPNMATRWMPIADS